MWRLQGPAGLQVRLVGAGCVGTGGSFLAMQCSAVLCCRRMQVLWGCSGETFHSFQTTPLWLLPHCLHPYTPTYRIQAVDGVIDALTSAWDGQAGGWPVGWLGWCPSDIPHASFNLSFPVLTNESCSFRGSHLGSQPVYWPGATSDFVSVSDQLCQLSLSRGLSLSSVAVGAWAWPLCLVHVVVLVSPKEARLSWLDELAHACHVGASPSHSMPSALGHRYLSLSNVSSHFQRRVDRVSPSPGQAGRQAGQAVYLGARLCRAPLGKSLKSGEGLLRPRA